MMFEGKWSLCLFLYSLESSVGQIKETKKLFEGSNRNMFGNLFQNINALDDASFTREIFFE